MFDASSEHCVMCGGDGRIGNAFGATKTCPGCGGSGRRMEDYGHRDVTKTKNAQGRQPAAAQKATKEPDAPKRTVPMTLEGTKLAAELKASSMTEETKIRLLREILEHENTHGLCTRTFAKKLRKQINAVP